MFKLKDFGFSAVIVAYAAIINLFGVENVIFKVFTESSEPIDVLRNERNEVLKLVELKEFTEVDRMLSGMKRNSTEFEMIVEEIVNKINQSDISFEYATKTSVPEVNCLILKNLWIEKNSTNDTNLFQTMDIYKAFNSKVIQNKIVGNESMKSLGCKTFAEEIRSEIQNKSVSHLKSLLLPDFFDEFGTKKFLDHLFKTSEELFEDVHKMLIDEIYEILPLDELLYRTFQSTCYPFPLNVFTISHLFSKNATILKTRDLDFWIPVWLIEEKREYEKNNNLTDYLENKFTQLLDYFSSAVKTLLLSENVCFRNYISKEYICRSSIENEIALHDIELCAERSLENFWQIDYFDDIFKIQESNNTNQRMYISETQTYILQVGNSLGFDEWEFYKEDNSFFIYNLGTGKFLCLSDNKLRISLDGNGHHHDDECRWLVEDCKFF